MVSFRFVLGLVAMISICSCNELMGAAPKQFSRGVTRDNIQARFSEEEVSALKAIYRQDYYKLINSDAFVMWVDTVQHLTDIGNGSPQGFFLSKNDYMFFLNLVTKLGHIRSIELDLYGSQFGDETAEDFDYKKSYWDLSELFILPGLKHLKITNGCAVAAQPKNTSSIESLTFTSHSCYARTPSGERIDFSKFPNLKVLRLGLQLTDKNIQDLSMLKNLDSVYKGSIPYDKSSFLKHTSR